MERPRKPPKVYTSRHCNSNEIRACLQYRTICFAWLPTLQPCHRTFRQCPRKINHGGKDSPDKKTKFTLLAAFYITDDGIRNSNVRSTRTVVLPTVQHSTVRETRNISRCSTSNRCLGEGPQKYAHYCRKRCKFSKNNTLLYSTVQYLDHGAMIAARPGLQHVSEVLHSTL